MAISAIRNLDDVRPCIGGGRRPRGLMGGNESRNSSLPFGNNRHEGETKDL